MTENEFMRIIEILLLPPALIIWVGLLIRMLVTIRPRIFSRLFLLALLVTFLLSVPAVSQWLIDGFQDDFPALKKLPPEADVIVVLGGGHFPGGWEYGMDGQPGPHMLQRLVYAGWLAKQSGLPVIISEARTRNERHTQRHAGADFLRKVLGVSNVTVEGRATNTFENAKFAAPLLKGYHRPVLVTNYWHMARAVESFMYFGIDPLPAPTGWDEVLPPMKAAYWSWLPQPRALAQSYTALHELLGYYWYRWKRFSNGAPSPQHN